MFEDVKEEPDERFTEELEFERKAVDCQEEYNGMLRKYQYLILKESMVSRLTYLHSIIFFKTYYLCFFRNIAKHLS